MTSSPGYIADFDSASAMVRALARCLEGRGFPDLGNPRALRPLAIAGNALPPAARRFVYTWTGWVQAASPRRASGVRAEDVSRWIAGVYPKRRYPAVMVGASNGALVHLCAALGIPWLPQTYLIAFRQSAPDPDDFHHGMEIAIPLGRKPLAGNPELRLHHMHDPNQDRLMVRRMTYFRVKRTRLGAAFERFLAERLAPGGTIFVAACRHSWPVTRVDGRYVFQAGGAGGATPEEYLRGGPRVAAFLREQGSPHDRWRAPPADGEAPEAEWGFEPALGEDIERFARARGYRVVRIAYDQPEQPAPLVADLYRWWYARRGLPADRLVVDSFILMDPWWTLRTASVPFWTKFAVEPSAEALEAYLDAVPPFERIGVMLFSHGVRSVGLAAIERWRAVLARAVGRFLGVSEAAFPADFATFARYGEALRKWGPRHPAPEPLGLERLDEFLAETRGRYAVGWQDADGR